MNVKHLPFKLCRDTAKDKWHAFHRVNKILGPRQSQLEIKEIRKLYLPFYHFNIDVYSCIDAFIPGRAELKTHWLKHSYTPSNCNAMQMCGTLAFPSAVLNRIKLALNTQFDYTTESSNDSNDAEVLNYSVPLHMIISNQVEPFIQSKTIVHNNCHLIS